MVFLTSEASAACVDDLHKLADENFAIHEIAEVEGTEQRSTEGNVFLVYFDKINQDHPLGPFKQDEKDKVSPRHVVAIRSAIYGEGGQSHYRISFLNKADFVIRAISEEYEGRIGWPHGTETLKSTSTDYLFCGNALQIPANQQAGKNEADYRKEAEENRALFFKASELTPYLMEIAP